MKLRKMLVTLDGEVMVEAYVPETKWNGFQTPYMEMPAARQVSQWVNGLDGQSMGFQPAGSLWWFEDEEYAGIGKIRLEWPGQLVETEDGPIWAYPIGAYEWAWMEAE